MSMQRNSWNFMINQEYSKKVLSELNSQMVWDFLDNPMTYQRGKELLTSIIDSIVLEDYDNKIDLWFSEGYIDEIEMDNIEEVKTLEYQKNIINEIIWGYIYTRKLSYLFITDYLPYLDVFRLSTNQELPEEFLATHWERVNWSSATILSRFSEEFMLTHKNLVNWYWASAKQKLSENVIREMEHKVDWLLISQNQDLSDSFIEEFKDKLDMNSINRRRANAK